MKPLCSIIIPSRGRPGALQKSVESFFASASRPDRLRAVIRMDDDDPTRDKFVLRNHPNVKIVTGPRYDGYGSVSKFVTEAEEQAESVWSFLCDDDAWLVGQGWDDLLAELPTTGWYASPDRYHLGFSSYGPGSCGPEGPFYPTLAWKQWGATEIGPMAGLWLIETFKAHGWQCKILPGTKYRHNHKVSY